MEFLQVVFCSWFIFGKVKWVFRMSSRLTLRRVKFSNPRTDWWPNQDHFDPQGTIDSIFAPSRTACRNYMITNTHLLVRYPLPKIYIEMFSDLTFGSVSFVKSNPSISRPSERTKKNRKKNHDHQEFIAAVHPRSRGRPPEPSWAENIGFRWKNMSHKKYPDCFGVQ